MKWLLQSSTCCSLLNFLGQAYKMTHEQIKGLDTGRARGDIFFLWRFGSKIEQDIDLKMTVVTLAVRREHVADGSRGALTK